MTTLYVIALIVSIYYYVSYNNSPDLKKQQEAGGILILVALFSLTVLLRSCDTDHSDDEYDDENTYTRTR